MSPDLLKLLGAVVILGLALFGGYLPTFLRRTQKAARWFGLGNAFAGGVFLGAGLLHLLPHAVEGFEHLAGEHAHGHDHSFPWAMALAAAGFLFILLIEKVAPPRRDFDEPRMVDEALGHHHAHLAGATYPAVLLLALSVHAFFAGVAMGTASSATDIVAIIIAVVAHKLMESFALGVTLVGSPYPRQVVNRLIALFACVTPAGILLGTLAFHGMHNHSLEMAEAVFNSLAAGTFLYIASMDILTEEFHRPKDRWAKYGLVLLGFILMALIMH